MTTTDTSRTLPGSYWVRPELLAGRYPADLSALLELGVRAFVDLTEADELPSYAQSLPSGVTHHRIAVTDFTCPSAGQIREALALLHEPRGVVYLHCRGGCGRTGVIVGCYLVEAGLSPDAALARVQELTGRRCPETPDQVDMVRSWLDN
jgi:protein-tyrosine phosphatase